MESTLLNKYLAGDASQEEKESIQLWLEADENNQKEFMALRSLYDITLLHLEEKRTENRKRKLLVDFLRIAAAILITFTCTYWFLQSRQTTPQPADATVMQTLHVPAGQRAELTLSDGTKVWLHSLTTFTFPAHFSGAIREVYLDGEGYFDVQHDENRQFKINTSDYFVKVLGTEFNVIAYRKNGYFETSLLKGVVDISSYDEQQNISLTPGKLVYSEKGQLQTTSIRHYDYFLWKKGIISFDHERIEDILKKLELYYDIRIENQNKSITNMRYTGKFRTNDGLKHILDVLQVPTGLQYQKDNENNFVLIY
ncbi:MAG: DUF4974 domain-containing protein [Tannerella sp.]|jgi:ferric-dicitrate binding protein FerR (iron transport regulator)|nr:DUF4974 domain-containing protein [Tannerella sp.]